MTIPIPFPSFIFIGKGLVELRLPKPVSPVPGLKEWEESWIAKATDPSKPFLFVNPFSQELFWSSDRDWRSQPVSYVPPHFSDYEGEWVGGGIGLTEQANCLGVSVRRALNYELRHFIHVITFSCWARATGSTRIAWQLAAMDKERINLECCFSNNDNPIYSRIRSSRNALLTSTCPKTSSIMTP